MSILDNHNIRSLILDIHDPVTPSNVVVYRDSVDNTILWIRLIDDSYYYTIPENAKIRVSINDISVDASNIEIVDRYKGFFEIKLNNNLFSVIDNQYEIIIEIYSADTDIGYGEGASLTLKTTIMYSTGIDNQEQSIQSFRFPNTTYSIPNNPNPDWDQFLKSD